MIRKFLLGAFLMGALQFGLQNEANAQSTYKTAVGMRVDFGTGGSFAGISGKHFFNENSAGELQLLFGTGVTLLGAEYQYHGDIQNAQGLKWYAGLGPTLAFGRFGGTELLLRPVVGLDYKINNVPLNAGFDWRPTFSTASGVTSRFTAARFGIAFRYTIK